MAKPVAIRSGSSSTSRDESPAMERVVRVEIGWEDGLGKPARQRSPTRNRLLLPGTAPLRAWRPTWTEIRDPVRPWAPCGQICGGTVGSGWSGPVRAVMRGRGSVGRAPRHAPARSGREAGMGLLVPRWTGRTCQRAATRTRRTGGGPRGFPLAPPTTIPATCSDFRGCWLAKTSRVGLNRSQRRGRVRGSRFARDPGAPASARRETRPPLACGFGFRCTGGDMYSGVVRFFYHAV